MPDRETAPQYLFENFGSRGDVVPFIDIASELVRRGHRCTLLANERFGAEAQAQGLRFHATTRNLTHHQTQRPAADYLYHTFDGVRDYFERPGAFDASTVVVNSGDWSSSEPLA